MRSRIKQIAEFLRDKHHLIFKVFLFAIASGIIVYLFPREGKFKYEFQKGKPWPHADLIAPFDFPIYKSTELIESEKEEIEANKKTYFFRNYLVEKESSEKFSIEFDHAWILYLAESEIQFGEKEKNRLFKRGINLLSKLYERGVIEIDEVIEGKEQDFEIYLLENNLESAFELNEFLTIQTAIQFIKANLREYSEAEIEMLITVFEESIQRNILYDQASTSFVLEQELSKVSPTFGLIQKGEQVVEKGDVLNEEKFNVVESLKKEYEEQSGVATKTHLILLGQIVLVSLMMVSLVTFLLAFRKEIIRSDLKIVFLLLQIVLFVFMAKMAISIENINLYLVPFCILPLVIRTFFDQRIALFTYLVTILIVGFIAPNPYEFIILQMIAGILTLFLILNLRRRSDLFTSSLIIFISYTLVYIGIELIQEGSFQEMNWKFTAWFFGNAMLTLFTYPLIYAFEKIFGFVSAVTLMELADTNNKLLRKLNLKAPGTFQHSLQVANLAEEAIRSVNGNTLLVRTGAMYHDIGKMNSPNYFIENQNSDYNPHDELSPEESATIIIDHVIDGIEIARRNKLPDIIVDFIRTHHGTSKTMYFLKQHQEQNDLTDIDESVFQYPGPKPYSKETAVLMMADSVEAASRSLPSYDGESIEKLVNGIINHQIKEEQFEMSDITFKDINQIKKIFIKKLKSMYHVRVEYPD